MGRATLYKQTREGIDAAAAVTTLLQQLALVAAALGPVIFRDCGKLAEFAELPT